MLAMTGERGEISLFAGADTDRFRERCEIEVKGGRGAITANCPRALLLGVYAFLRECGCRFLRPGEKGELVPKRKISEDPVPRGKSVPFRSDHFKTEDYN